MMRLVESSVPGAVERDAAIRLLAERSILTRAVCRELLEARDFADRRPAIALALLLQWVQQNVPASVRIEPHPSDGIDQMIVPQPCEELHQEIRDGAQVGEALFMLWTADTPTQARGDEDVIRNRLRDYWAAHPTAAPALSLIH